MMKKPLLTSFMLLLLVINNIGFASDKIHKVSSAAPVATSYDKLKAALEDERLFVVFEPDIGRNVSGFKDNWGDNYNRNQLSEIRSLVFCNAWFANEVSNLDPDMLALCPLKITVTEKAGKSTALFVLPTAIAGDSPAAEVLKELESKVKSALSEAGFK